MKWTLAPLAAVALAIPLPLAYAAGPFDGTWSVVSPLAVGSGTTANPQCPAVDLRMQIKNSQIVGSLQRAGRSVVNSQPSNASPITGSNATPVKGSVQSDGSLTAQWQGIHATGKLTGDRLQMSWIGACGAREATGRRVG
jgi:hypothetical protein